MITDVFLQEIAKSINGESSTVPSHMAFSNDSTTPDPTDTSLASEFDRSSITGSRVTNSITFNSIRSSATASGSGDTINKLGLFSASSSGNLFMEATVPSILHTDDFDFEVDATITISRR